MYPPRARGTAVACHLFRVAARDNCLLFVLVAQWVGELAIMLRPHLNRGRQAICVYIQCCLSIHSYNLIIGCLLQPSIDVDRRFIDLLSAVVTDTHLSTYLAIKTPSLAYYSNESYQ